nr:peptide-methionine (S)-S-oxide reductase MsrA [Liquorilactobacillus sicerae]
MKNQSAAVKLERDLYNLILNPATRQWEREQLLIAKNQLEKNSQQAWENLELKLRPLAIRNNLTPDMTDFYTELTGQSVNSAKKLIQRHYQADLPEQQRAIFAGGCFWCMVEPFELKPGVIAVIAGYTGGQTIDPTYEQVSSQDSGHVEAVEIIFDQRYLSYRALLECYWQLIDPTDARGQINDRGQNYRAQIFYLSPQQKLLAEQTKLAISRDYREPIVVPILPASDFYPAENFHQRFYQKYPQRYRQLKVERKFFLFGKRWIERLKK